MACCVLHNICIDVGDPSAIDPVEDDDEMDQSSCNGDEQSDARGIREDIKTLNQSYYFYWNLSG